MAIIFDLEATCNDRGYWDHETIEIGAVNTENGRTFDCYIKPIANPILTDFCKNLTGISQKIVDIGVTFPEAYNSFLNWGGRENTYISWGYYDIKQFEKDCIRHNIEPVPIKHFSLKHNYAAITNTHPKGMAEVLRREGLILEGCHHNGLDDALNIAKIYKVYQSLIEKTRKGFEA